MALTNYADLLASVANWLHRTDLTAIIPDWVTLCETTINYGDGNAISGLRTATQETVASLTCTPGTQTVSLPVGFLEVRKVYITVSGIRRELVQRPIVPIGTTEAAAVRSNPETYYITGSSLYLIPIPDQAYIITLLYYAKVGSLAISSTNWLMTAAPVVYLSGTIAHGAPWLGASFDPSPWLNGFQVGMKQVARSDKRSRFSNARLRSEAAGMTGDGYGYGNFLAGT